LEKERGEVIEISNCRKKRYPKKKGIHIYIYIYMMDNVDVNGRGEE
jgi:hypothetical protein